MRRTVYRFGPYLLDPAARELRRDDARVTATLKVIECLVWLIEHRDRAVGRDELIAAVWGRVDVSDTHLSKTLFEVRRAVGDTGDVQRMIATVPRFGYRWVSAVSAEAIPVTSWQPLAVQPATPDTDAPVSEPSESQEPDRSMRRRYAVAGVLAVLMAWLSIELWHRRVTTAADSSLPNPLANGRVSRDMMAVMPVHIDAGEEWDWLRLGLMDLIANRLRNAGMRVVPSENVTALTSDVLGATAWPDAAGKRVSQATGAGSLAVTTVRHTDADWTAQIELQGAANASVEGHGPDAATAVRTATDRLLRRLGRTQDSAPNLGSPADELHQRVEAALLADDPDAARAWGAQLPAAVLETPEGRLELARLDVSDGHIDAARQALTALESEVSSERDPALRARILMEQGRIAFYQADGHPAEIFTAVLALLDAHPRPELQAAAYKARGIAHAQAGRNDEARSDFSMSGVLLQRIGDTLGIARLDSNEAMLDMADDQLTDALPLLQRASQQFERFDQGANLARTLLAEVKVELALARPDLALQISDRGIDLLRRLKTPLTRTQLFEMRARALAENGQLAQSRRAIDDAIAEARLAGEAAQELQLHAWRAGVDLANHDPESAFQPAKLATEHLTSPDLAVDRARAWLTLIRALRVLQRDGPSNLEVDRLAEWAASGPRAEPRMLSELAQAERAWASDSKSQATAHFKTALDTARSTGAPRNIIDVAGSWGLTLLADGDLVKAAEVIGQTGRWAEHDYMAALLQAHLHHALGRGQAWRESLTLVHSLAGERVIPEKLTTDPSPPVALK